jgi:outer membrane protein assembly factor BamB
VPYRPAWSAGVTGKSHTAPLRAPDGTLYVGSDPGYLYAFAPTGGLIWRFTAPGGVRSAPARSPDGTLYVADDSGALSALSPEGTLLWQRELGASSAGSPLLLGGDIYLSVDHALLRIGSAGQTIWRSELGAAASPAALVRGPSGPLLAVGEADGWLAAVGLDGALRWRTQLAAPALAQPADDHAGGVLAGDAAGALHRLDAGSGAISWERPLVHPVQSDSLPPGGALIAAPPLVAADGTIYLGGRDGSLSALGPDGSLRWRYESGSDITATPTQLADGSVLVGLLDWRVVAVSPAGRARWEIRLNGAVRSTPLYDQAGDLYVSTVGGRIYSFSGGTTAGEPAPQS